MQQLQAFEKELYQTAMSGKRWMFVPRVDGSLYGLAIIAVGLQGKVEIPFESCCTSDFFEIINHTDCLNTEMI